MLVTITQAMTHHHDPQQNPAHDPYNDLNIDPGHDPPP